MKENRFNLIDEGWIPVADHGLVGLRGIFQNPDLKALGGDPIQKIAVFKLLLAIAQTAWTPVDDEDWHYCTYEAMCKKVLAYLEEWYDAFWLYGERPFLQMPSIEKAELKSVAGLLSMVSTGNTTILTQSQMEKKISDAERALILVQQMGFSFGGKTTDNKVVLSAGYLGKTKENGKASSGKAGPSLAFMGLLHSFIFGSSLQESVRFNLFTKQDIDSMGMFPVGLGIAPWEKMPEGEDDEIAKNLRDSYIGRLVPLSRFMLFADDKVHYSEGIAHKSYLESMVDPSCAVDFSAKKPAVLWADPDKRPWRQLTALLSFMGREQGKHNCFQLRLTLPRLNGSEQFSIWSGGVKVNSNAGEQYVSGNNDTVESEVVLSGDIFDRASDFYSALQDTMNYMDALSKRLWSCVTGYFRDMKADAKDLVNYTTSMYWQLCERSFQKLIEVCSDKASEDEIEKMKKQFSAYAYQVYDRYCPNQSARQMEAWANNRFRQSKDKQKDKKGGSTE